MCGNRAYCWKTMLTGLRLADTAVTSVPCRRIRPASGVSNPPIIRSVVVFPQPLGPRIEKNSPSAISNVTSFTAVCLPNRLLTPVIAIATRPFSGMGESRPPSAACTICETTLSLVEHAITQSGVGSTLASVPRRADAGTQLAEVGTTIRRVRRELGLSLRDVGRATGFSISFLSLVERGRSSISLTSLHTLAVALGVDMRVFFPAQPETVVGAQVSRAGDTRLPIRDAHTYRLLGATGFDRALEPLL